MRVSPSASVALKSKTKVWFSGMDRFPSDWKAGAWLGPLSTTSVTWTNRLRETEVFPSETWIVAS